MRYLNKFRRLAALLTALSLLLGLLSACGGNTAAVMKLRKTRGKVSVSDDAGKSLEVERDLGLYSGYGVKTKGESYAWIDLDEVKLTKLDEDSSVEITKNGGELELNLKSGGLFFNITEPLEEDETLEIRTSSMVVGIRGTCGWVTVSDDRDTMQVWLLEGKVRCETDGARETVSAGETGILTSGGTITVDTFGAQDIPAFVLEEVEDDEELMRAVAGGSGGGGGDTSGWEWPTVPGRNPAGGPEEDPPQQSGTGGTEGNITWDIQNGVLTISGTGDMEDYGYASSPWHHNTNAIQSVVIKPGITSIGKCAFSGLENLVNVTIPDSVVSIGDEVFLSCHTLSNVTIPGSVTVIGNRTFAACTSLTSVTIPDSVTSIGDYTFSGCTNLTSATIPDSVMSIGDAAFYDCPSLIYVTIPSRVTSIGFSTFAACTSLTSVAIPGSVISIGENAFSGCLGLTSVTIPSSVTSIGNHAFSNCDSLTNVTIPDSVISIGDRAFWSCTGLTSVTIPGSVSSIGYTTFGDCNNLTDVYFNGTQEQFDAISIGLNNGPLQRATIHYVP